MKNKNIMLFIESNPSGGGGGETLELIIKKKKYIFFSINSVFVCVSYIVFSDFGWRRVVHPNAGLNGAGGQRDRPGRSLLCSWTAAGGM